MQNNEGFVVIVKGFVNTERYGTVKAPLTRAAAWEQVKALSGDPARMVGYQEIQVYKNRVLAYHTYCGRPLPLPKKPVRI